MRLSEAGIEGSTLDKIIIDSLVIFANHGVLGAEKDLGQKFLVSAELHLDLRNAGLTDDLSKTVNYADVCSEIVSIMKGESFDLIEACAEKIAGHILHNYPSVREVMVKVEKPWAPVAQPLRTIAVQVFRKRSGIYLGLGSNMGDKKANLDKAICKMREVGLNIAQISSYHETKPISDIPQEDFLNCVIRAETTLTPSELMGKMLQIESELGRKRTSIRFGPRIIDIDLLFYDKIITDCDFVTVPHPRMHTRPFVLEPFCEIDPFFVHPLLNKRIFELMEEFT